MRKHSTPARRIHTLMHDMLHAIEHNDPQRRNRALIEALDLHHHDTANAGTGYSLLWLDQIATHHPAALTAAPQLATFLNEYRIQRRAYIRGKRDYTCGRIGNPYCAYTNQIAYDAWDAGFDDAILNDNSTDDWDIGLNDDWLLDD